MQKFIYEKLEELPNGINSIYYFPGLNSIGGKDGLILKIDDFSNHRSWIGIFAFGELTSKGVTGIYSMPDFDKIYIVSKGMGYWVNFDTPTNWGIIDCHPIIECMPIILKKIIVFGEFTKLVAYGNDGLIWKTKRLSFDNLKLLETDNDFLKGEYYDIRSESNEQFEINLHDGQCKSSGEIL